MAEATVHPLNTLPPKGRTDYAIREIYPVEVAHIWPAERPTLERLATFLGAAGNVRFPVVSRFIEGLIAAEAIKVSPQFPPDMHAVASWYFKYRTFLEEIEGRAGA